jgi:hypothetical protein
MKIMDNQKLYFLVMILCFMLGGFNLISSLLTLNIGVSDMNISNNSSLNYTFCENCTNQSFPNPRPRNDFFREAGFNILVSNSYISLINGVLFIFAGIIIYFLIRKKEKKVFKQSLIDSMLQPQELSIIKFLEENDGKATQNELVKELGFNKVIISRGIKSLESKKLIEKTKYGMTNKIILKQ